MEGDRVVGIRINGEECWFDAEAFARGRLAIIECGEQCDGCGEQITATGIVLYPRQVKCHECGTRYNVARGMLVRHADDSLRVHLDDGETFAALK